MTMKIAKETIYGVKVGHGGLETTGLGRTKLTGAAGKAEVEANVNEFGSVLIGAEAAAGVCLRPKRYT